MNIESELRTAINELLERKKLTIEGESNPHIPVIRDFIREELQRQKVICDAMSDDKPADIMVLNEYFTRLIGLK